MWMTIYRSKPDGWTHNFPVNDIAPHHTEEDDYQCDCNPTLDLNLKLVTHYAFDGRDIIERLEAGEEA